MPHLERCGFPFYVQEKRKSNNGQMRRDTAMESGKKCGKMQDVAPAFLKTSPAFLGRMEEFEREKQ